jgi:hypothetical protein
MFAIWSLPHFFLSMPSFNGRVAGIADICIRVFLWIIPAGLTLAAKSQSLLHVRQPGSEYPFDRRAHQ